MYWRTQRVNKLYLKPSFEAQAVIQKEGAMEHWNSGEEGGISLKMLT